MNFHDTLDHFLNCNDTECRLARTIVQGVLGVLVANIDVMMGAIELEPTVRAMLVALVMAVLTPVMTEIGKHVSTEGEQGR